MNLQDKLDFLALLHLIENGRFLLTPTIKPYIKKLN